MNKIVECVPNFSEGRDAAKVDQLVAAIAAVPKVFMLDRELDADHNRSVLTFAGEPEAVVEAALRAARKAVELIDLNTHTGEHPRIGALDVLPFVPLKGVTMDDCVHLAQAAGERLARELGVPVYLYEHAASKASRLNLADIRRGEFEMLRREIELNPDLQPDFGEPILHPTAGATAVGARPPLIAYNVNLATSDINVAKRIARAVRGSSGGLQYVRALEINLKARGLVQVSMNLVNYDASPLFRVFELVKLEAERYGTPIVGSEIVGLVPQAALNDCADFYLRFENFSEDMVLENRLHAALETYAQQAQIAEKPAAPQPETEPEPETDQWLGSLEADEWLGSFGEDVAAAALTPGGGSVSAYTGALAAALGKMVCNLTHGKKKYEEVATEIEDILAQLGELGADLREAVAEDADSQVRMLEAINLPRVAEAERLARAEAMEEATKSLLSLRMRVAQSSMETLDLLDELAEVGNPAVFADLAVGAQLALTALRGASYQVLSNLGSVGDEEFVRQRRAELDDLVARGQETADGIEERFFQMYPR